MERTTLNGEPLASTIRCAKLPTIFNRSSSISINHSSSSGSSATRARNPLTSSGVYVDPPPMTATLSILLFNSGDHDALHELPLRQEEHHRGQEHSKDSSSCRTARVIAKCCD